MILLDTNVVSAVMAPAPPIRVIGWLNQQDTASLYLATVSIAEIAYGLQALPKGKRRSSLEQRFELFIGRAFDQRILGFDEPAARLYGEIMAHRRRKGRPLAVLDGQIAAVARASRFAVATRNVRDFIDCGIELVDPFENAR